MSKEETENKEKDVVKMAPQNNDQVPETWQLTMNLRWMRKPDGKMALEQLITSNYGNSRWQAVQIYEMKAPVADEGEQADGKAE